MFRTRAAETEHALTATYELLEQSLEDMLHPRVLPSLTRPAMGAEPWLDNIRHGINPSISFGSDYCATTRRKRDVLFKKFVSPLPPRVLAGQFDLPRAC